MGNAMTTGPAWARITVKTLLAAIMAVALLCVFPRTASAVPTLQLFSPNATYDTASESLLTFDDPFELWIAGARTPDGVHVIDQLELFVAILGYDESWDKSVGSTSVELTIETITSTDPIALGNPDKNPVGPWSLGLDSSDLLWGRPAEFDAFNGNGLPWHGVYPAWYWRIVLPQALDVDDDQETVYNFGEEFDSADPAASGTDAFGDIQYYEMSYTPYHPGMSLDVDLIGFAHNGVEIWRFSPFSHDARAAYVPEPATLVLFAAALCGQIIWTSRRKKTAVRPG